MQFTTHLFVLLSIALSLCIQAVPMPTQTTNNMTSLGSEAAVLNSFIGPVVNTVGAAALTIATVGTVYALTRETPCTIEEALKNVQVRYICTKADKDAYHLELRPEIGEDSLEREDIYAFKTLNLLSDLQNAQHGYLRQSQILENPLFTEPLKFRRGKYEADSAYELLACRIRYRDQITEAKAKRAKDQVYGTDESKHSGEKQ
jgi:hypothetical protein